VSEPVSRGVKKGFKTPVFSTFTNSHVFAAKSEDRLLRARLFEGNKKPPDGCPAALFATRVT
jgi:hypothetical protein